VIVPYLVVKNILVQKDLGDKRENWMTNLQEYDPKINHANIVKEK
jgi:hypothetical protein